MTIAREEIFGPVLSVLSFTDAADVVKQALNSAAIHQETAKRLGDNQGQGNPRLLERR